MLWGLCAPANAEEAELDRMIAETANALSSAGGHAGSVLADSKQVTPGSSLSDWMAITLARSETPERYDQYLSGLKKYVEKAYAKNGGLHDIKATEYHRIWQKIGRDSHRSDCRRHL